MTRLRKLAIEEHEASKQYHAAIKAELLSRVSVFHKDYVNQVNSRDKVLCNVFRACYFLAKQEISNRKMIPLLEFLEQVGVKDMQYFRHRSVRDIFLTIGQTIKEIILERIREAGIYGLLVDDATNVAFVCFVNPSSSRQEVTFLFIEDVLKDPEADGASAEVLLNVLLKQVEHRDLKMENMMSLATDGASVMTGKRNGLAAKLKSLNNKLISFHCVCHRLALSCVDSNDETHCLCCGNHPSSTVEVLPKFTEEDVKVPEDSNLNTNQSQQLEVRCQQHGVGRAVRSSAKTFCF